MNLSRFRWPLTLAFLMLILPVLAACGGSESGADAGQSPGMAAKVEGGVDLAPEIGTIDNWYNGDATTLAALRGEPVLLVFWADY